MVGPAKFFTKKTFLFGAIPHTMLFTLLCMYHRRHYHLLHIVLEGGGGGGICIIFKYLDFRRLFYHVLVSWSEWVFSRILDIIDNKHKNIEEARPGIDIIKFKKHFLNI